MQGKEDPTSHGRLQDIPPLPRHDDSKAQQKIWNEYYYPWANEAFSTAEHVASALIVGLGLDPHKIEKGVEVDRTFDYGEQLELQELRVSTVGIGPDSSQVPQWLVEADEVTYLVSGEPDQGNASLVHLFEGRRLLSLSSDQEYELTTLFDEIAVAHRTYGEQ